jgi:hypothetical protein
MKREEMLQHLKRWESVVREIEAVDDALEELTGREPEGRLTTAMWAAVGAYAETLETLLIGSSANTWLEWYWVENRMGERGLTVATDAGERAITSIEALADFLMECHA